MIYSHLRADCLYTGISFGPNDWQRVWEAFTFLPVVLRHFDYILVDYGRYLVMPSTWKQ